MCLPKILLNSRPPEGTLLEESSSKEIRILSWEGGMMAPQNVFDHCVETPWSMKMKLLTFNINLWRIRKIIVSMLGYPVLP